MDAEGGTPQPKGKISVLAFRLAPRSAPKDGDGNGDLVGSRQTGSKRIGEDDGNGGEVDGTTGTSKKARVADSASEYQEVGQTEDEEL